MAKVTNDGEQEYFAEFTRIEGKRGTVLVFPGEDDQPLVEGIAKIIDGEGSFSNPVEPDAKDDQRWYRIQWNYSWYAVEACCRSCATRKLHTYINGESRQPVTWLVKL